MIRRHRYLAREPLSDPLMLALTVTLLPLGQTVRSCRRTRRSWHDAAVRDRYTWCICNSLAHGRMTCERDMTFDGTNLMSSASNSQYKPAILPIQPKMIPFRCNSTAQKPNILFLKVLSALLSRLHPSVLFQYSCISLPSCPDPAGSINRMR